jgi:hypothetical protein
MAYLSTQQCEQCRLESFGQAEKSRFEKLVRLCPDNYCHVVAMRSRALRIRRPVILLEGGYTRHPDIHIPSTHQSGKETLIGGR